MAIDRLPMMRSMNASRSCSRSTALFRNILARKPRDVGRTTAARSGGSPTTVPVVCAALSTPGGASSAGPGSACRPPTDDARSSESKAAARIASATCVPLADSRLSRSSSLPCWEDSRFALSAAIPDSLISIDTGTSSPSICSCSPGTMAWRESTATCRESITSPGISARLKDGSRSSSPASGLGSRDVTSDIVRKKITLVKR